jgi:Carboxypeptidase regulatory-like domain
MLSPIRGTRGGSDKTIAALATLFVCLALLLALSISPSVLWADTCVASPPPKVEGALCGRVFDPAGATVADIDLRAVDKAGSVVGHAHTDSKGDFRFSLLPEGIYRLTTTAPGWHDFIGEVHVVNSKKTTCKQPLTVVLAVTSCQGGISKRKPAHWS